MTEFNPHLLSSEAQRDLYRIAGKDGNEFDLSSVDLADATPQEIQTLVGDLTADHDVDPNEQALVSQLYSLLEDKAILGEATTYRAYDFTEGQVRLELDPLVPLTVRDADDVAGMRADVASGVFESKTGRVQHSWDVRQMASIEDQQAVVDARQCLADDFGFDFGVDHDQWFGRDQLEAVRDSITADNLPTFMGNYLTAIYAHPGVNSQWNGVGGEEAADRMVFGKTAMMSETPDGRRVGDCQLFTYVGQRVFEALCPPDLRDQSFYAPIQMTGTRADGTTVAHEMGLMVIGDQAYMVSNNHVEPLPMPDDLYLQDLRDLDTAKGGDLHGVEVPRSGMAGGPLYAYAIVSLGLTEVTHMAFDSHLTLSDR